MKYKYTVVDLFCGCGGFSQGFIQAGFEVIAANDHWKPALITYKFNHKKTIIIEGDITLAETKEKLYSSIKGKKVNVIIGGPPCQAYSIAGNRNPDDPRGQLYLDFVEIVNNLKPDFFVMENVKGLLNMKHVNPNLNQKKLKNFKINCQKLQRYKDLKRFKAQRILTSKELNEFNTLKNNLKMIKNNIEECLIPLIDKILAKFESIDYKVRWKLLNSADYGVPQIRERVFFIGTKHKNIKIKFPKPTHTNSINQTRIDGFLSKSNKILKKWVPVKDVLKKYENMPENETLSHILTKHNKKFVERIKNTPIGGNVFKNYSDAWWRLDPNKPSRTVKENHGGVFIHYKYDRTCTPRELAALQSFDDSFIFKGTKSAILKQIGNAVPPLLAKNIADVIKLMLNQIYIINIKQKYI
ncbi:MAG: DNA cytosine methyltransferase [Promethearchaeia archaeon]